MHSAEINVNVRCKNKNSRISFRSSNTARRTFMSFCILSTYTRTSHMKFEYRLNVLRPKYFERLKKCTQSDAMHIFTNIHVFYRQIYVFRENTSKMPRTNAVDGREKKCAKQFSFWKCFDWISLLPHFHQTSAIWFSCRKIMKIIKNNNFAAI